MGTHVHSVERMPSNDKWSASGTAKVAVKPSLAGRGRTQRRRPSRFAAPSDVSGKFVNKRRSGPAVALVHTSCFTSPDCRCFLKICFKKGQKRNRNYLKCLATFVA